MSDPQDIRAWARSQGIEVGDRGRIPADLVREYETRGQPAEAEGPPVLISLDDPPPVAESPAGGGVGGEVPPAPTAPEPGAGGTRPAERPPRPAPRPRRRGLLSRARDQGPRPAHRRVSIENLVSSGWAMGAMAFARSPQALPVARILDMQAPVAGVIVEDIAKGTLVDRLLQPLARGGEKAEKAAALLGPPVVVAMITANPQLFPVLRPVLKMLMMSWVQIAGPAMTKVQKRQEKFAEEFGGVDLDGMIDALWAGLVEAGPTSDQEEEHIRRARGE